MKLIYNLFQCLSLSKWKCPLNVEYLNSLICLKGSLELWKNW